MPVTSASEAPSSQMPPAQRPLPCPSPLVSGPELGLSHGPLTHVVKHLALGGAVLLCDGVGHCIGAHEQRVPVVSAERQRRKREVSSRLERNALSEAKPLRRSSSACLLSPQASSSSQSPSAGHAPQTRGKVTMTPTRLSTVPLCQGLSTLTSLKPYNTAKVKHH